MNFFTTAQCLQSLSDFTAHVGHGLWVDLFHVFLHTEDIVLKNMVKKAIKTFAYKSTTTKKHLQYKSVNLFA